MLSIFLLLAAGSASSPALAGPLDLHDKTHYAILEKNSRLECLYVKDESYGFLFERKNDDVIHVSLITNGVNEGEKSAFTAEIKIKAAIGLYVYHYSRDGKFGRYIEFELRNQRDSFLGYRLPGQAMMTSAQYTTEEDGSEKETRFPDQSARLACKVLP